jgi:hypothetical protein
MEVCIAGGSPPSVRLCHERLKWPSQQSRAVVLLHARRQQVKYGCALCSPLFMPCTTTQPLTSSPLDAVAYPAPSCGVRCTGRETACSSVRQVDQARASARAQVPALPDNQQQNGRSHTSETESGKGTCELPAAASHDHGTQRVGTLVSQEQKSNDLTSLLESSCLKVWSGYVHLLSVRSRLIPSFQVTKSHGRMRSIAWVVR